MLIYTHCWELMNSVGSHGSLSLPFVMKVMVCHFMSDSHEVMTALIVVLPIIVVVEISATSSIFFFHVSFGFAASECNSYLPSVIVEFSLQSHRYVSNSFSRFFTFKF
jgi:hypothetical protein